MKRLLAIAVIALFATSCNQKHCWNCTVTYKNSTQFPTPSGAPGSGIKILPVCNMTKKDIKKYETDNSSSQDSSSITYECARNYYQ